jgi:hypothetical protein
MGGSGKSITLKEGLHLSRWAREIAGVLRLTPTELANPDVYAKCVVYNVF